MSCLLLLLLFFLLLLFLGGEFYKGSCVGREGKSGAFCLAGRSVVVFWLGSGGVHVGGGG